MPAPALEVLTVDGRVRLRLAGFGHADGATLQEAAGELVRKVLLMAIALRSGALRFSSDCPPDPSLLAYLWELGEIAAAGGDIRARLFDPGAQVT